VTSGEEAVVADIEAPAALAGPFTGVDAVVHLAAEASPKASWPEVRGPNIEGAYRVFEAARLAGVRRIVFASTQRVTGLYERGGAAPIRPDEPPRPDSLYAVSKVFGEALGRHYADAFGIHVVCLRLGWVIERPTTDEMRRLWLNPSDLGRIVSLALEAPVRFAIYYAVSREGPSGLDLTSARRELGYVPSDG
jgi:NAD+ dependent glucose-6-phosphate dehydrogenase